MIKTLFKWFTKPTYQSDLDRYIASKNPTTVSEVEHWTREYDKHFVWGRGL